jgi:hypothetical protein
VEKGLIDALKYLRNEFNSPSTASNVVAAISSWLKDLFQKLTKRENMTL